MRRRDMAGIVLGGAAAGVPLLALAQTTSRPDGSGCSAPCYPANEAESGAANKPVDLSFPYGNVLRWGADPTGAKDSTAAIQNCMDIAWSAGFHSTPWSGKGGATPVVLFPPGRYRVTNSIVVPTGVTVTGAAHPANTTSHTRIIMDSPPGSDNRNKAMFRFNRATHNNGGLMNSGITSTLENLEFWFVTPGGTFDAPLSSGIGFGQYPDGGTLVFDVDAADTRIVNCVFQHSPAAIRIKDVPLTEKVRADGWKGNRGVGIFVETCEFDSGCTHIYATASYVDLSFKNCQFFGAMHRYEGCTGSVVYQSGRWHGGAFVDAATVPNEFSRFELKAADVELTPVHAFVTLSRAHLIDISQNAALGGASGYCWIDVVDADGGCVVSNSINNSGVEARPGTSVNDFTAAIKLRGCRQVLVSGNNLSSTAAGHYNGFGILSADSRRPASGNFINGNLVGAPYGGPAFSAQSRFINVAVGDTLGMNQSAGGVSLFVDKDGTVKVRFPSGKIHVLAQE